MFNWDEFRNEKVTVWCDTEEKAREFIKECHKRGMKWHSSSSENETRWKELKNDTCYCFSFFNDSHLGFSSKAFYEVRGCKIIKWESEKMKFNVGDKVKAIDDRYIFTNKENGFIGEVVELLDERSPIEYKDLMVRDLNSQITYKVNSRHFELVEEPTEFTFQEVVARIKPRETYEAIDKVYATQAITMEEDNEIRIDILPNQTFIMSTYSLFKLQEPKKMYVLYEVIHAEKGKEYTFRPKEGYEVVPRDWVVCDTKKGKTFGMVIGSVVKQLTEKEYKQYKECWRA